MLEQAKIAAPYGYLVKPVPERELAATLEMALNRYKLDCELKESKENYQRVYENKMIAICIFDTDTLQIIDSSFGVGTVKGKQTAILLK